MYLTTEQINAIHNWWCHRLHLDNYHEICINPLFSNQLECFSAHLYELLHINRYFLEINLKVHQGVSLIVAEQGFQPEHSTLVHIFNLAIEKSSLPITAFKTGTQMIINAEGKINVKIILSGIFKRVYDTNNILFWDTKTNRNIPVQSLSSRELCLDPETNIDTLMQQLLQTFDSYTPEIPTLKK